MEIIIIRFNLSVTYVFFFPRETDVYRLLITSSGKFPAQTNQTVRRVNPGTLRPDLTTCL